MNRQIPSSEVAATAPIHLHSFVPA